MSSFFRRYKKYDEYEENNEKGLQHDLANDSEFSCKKIDNLKLAESDPQLRFINLGIVNVVEPLKNEVNAFEDHSHKRISNPRRLSGITNNTNNIKYMIYDNVYQNVLSFDIHELYKRYIKYNQDYIDTTYGKYHLSIKTINEIEEIIKNGYENF